MSFRVQQLLRAALGLGSRTSNCAGIAALVELRAASNGAVPALLGACTGPTAAVGGYKGSSAAVASLLLLQRALHTGLPRAAAAAAAATSEAEVAALNPLQQAPPPAAARAALGDSYPDEEPLRAKALLRNVAISPRKLNMFAKVVRGLSLEDALIQCQVSCKKSAGILRNVLMSAKANAVNNHGMDAEKLAVEHAYVGSGSHLKRTSVHGRGRSGVRLRYRSHLTVILVEKEGLRRRTKVLPMLAERWYGIQERKLGLAPRRKGKLQHEE